jgi:hypothetical protein
VLLAPGAVDVKAYCVDHPEVESVKGVRRCVPVRGEACRVPAMGGRLPHSRGE